MIAVPAGVGEVIHVGGFPSPKVTHLTLNAEVVAGVGGKEMHIGGLMSEKVTNLTVGAGLFEAARTAAVRAVKPKTVGRRLKNRIFL